MPEHFRSQQETYNQDLSSWLNPERPIDVPKGKAFDAWALRIKSPEEFESLGVKEKLLYFSWFGSLAPTTHNTVPERFVLNPEKNSIDLFVDRGTPEAPIILPASDPVGRQAAISIGSVIEYMALTVHSYEVESSLTVYEENSKFIRPPIKEENRYVGVASLAFSPQQDNTAHASWLEEILTRKSERKQFSDSIPVPDSFIDYLYKIADEQGVSLHVITNKMARMGLGTFQSMADTYVVNNGSFSRELGNWLLANDSDSGVGMRGREFGFGDEAAQKYSRGLQGKEHLNVQDLIGFSLGGKSLMKDSSAIFAITIPDDSLENRIKAGRVFAHSALFLNKNGFSTSMHAGVTEVQTANKALGAFLRTKERPTVLFRAGKPLTEANEMRPHSSRPSIEKLIIG